MTEVASASVLLEPDGTGFGRKIDSEIGPSLDRAGREGGRRFGTAMQASVGSSGIGAAGSKAGAAFGDGFSRDVNGKLRDSTGRFVKESGTNGAAAGRSAASGFGRGFGDAGSRAGLGASKGFSGSFLGGLKSLAGPAAVILGGLGVGNFLKDSFGEAREAQKVGALTDQVIKSTGGVAKVTAGQVGDLATAISNKTGIDDEAIQSASNLLLTFTNVRNEVGKGNDIFDQATQAATDMGAALGKDPKDSAIQLGKALNDPVKGVTALQKVGVSFTQQQKDQIATMVKSGDTLGAQKIILGELNKEFGGAAEASTTAGQKMGVAFGNLKEQVGTALLPIVDKFATSMSTKVIPAISGVIGILADGAFTSDLFAGFDVQEDSPIITFFFKVRENAIKLFDTLKVGIPAFKSAFSGEGITSDGIVGKFEQFGVIARTVFDAVKAGALKAFGFLKEVIPPILTSLKAFGAPLAAIVKQLLSASQESGVSTFQILSDVLKALPGILNAVLPLVENLAKFMGENQDLVAGLVVALTAGLAAFRTITVLVRAFTAVQAALNLVMAANPIALVVIAIAALVAGLIYAYNNSETFRDIVDGVWQKVQEVISFAWNNVIKPVIDFLVAAVQNAWQNFITFKDNVATAFENTKNVVREGVRQVVDFFLGMADQILTAADTAFGWIPGIGDKLHEAKAKFETFRDQVNASLAGIKDRTVNVDVNLAVAGNVDGVIAGIAAQAGRNASGTNSWRGGPTWVGEQGPELLNLPRGSQILSNRRSMSLVGSVASMSSDGSGPLVENHFHGNIVTPNYRQFEEKLYVDARRSAIGESV